MLVLNISYPDRRKLSAERKITWYKNKGGTDYKILTKALGLARKAELEKFCHFMTDDLIKEYLNDAFEEYKSENDKCKGFSKLDHIPLTI